MTLSPLFIMVFGPTCRFEPSCSVYIEQAIREYGAIRGSIMGLKRLFRCHPWHEGGFDPVLPLTHLSNEKKVIAGE